MEARPLRGSSEFNFTLPPTHPLPATHPLPPTPPPGMCHPHDARSWSHYEALGVEKDASDPEIRDAYKRLALQHHPDRIKGDAEATESGAENFKAVASAYECLSDPQLRRAYDRDFELGGLFDDDIDPAAEYSFGPAGFEKVPSGNAGGSYSDNERDLARCMEDHQRNGHGDYEPPSS